VSHAAADVLHDVLPYLVIKREQAYLAFEFQETIGTRGPAVPDGVYSQRVAMYERMAVLNRRGVA
jgi:hypothetical protein